MATESETPRLPTKGVLLGAAGLLVAMVALYLGYDLLKPVVSPCESIFQQTRVSLRTEIEVLETTGKVFVGSSQVQELDRQAHATAIRLKTCCTVLDAGKVNADQFLECQQGADRFRAELAAITEMVGQAQTAQEAGDVTAVNREVARIQRALQSARRDAETLRGTVRYVAREFGGAGVNPDTAPVEGEPVTSEVEPNDEVLTPNRIPLGAWVSAEIAGPEDSDYYRFTTPPIYRDWIRVEIENRSTTWAPWYRLLDANKAHVSEHGNRTPGANVSHAFVAPPETDFHLQVGKYHDSAGAYRLRVTPTRAYDPDEPNDDIRSPTAIEPGVPRDAAIMDGGDDDFYVFETGPDTTRVTVSIANRSATLSPWFRLLDGNKAAIGEAGSRTNGADASQAFDAVPNARYHVHVGKYHGSAGAYTLSVEVE